MVKRLITHVTLTSRNEGGREAFCSAPRNRPRGRVPRSGLDSGARVPPKLRRRAGRLRFTATDLRIPRQRVAGDPQPSLPTSSPRRQRVLVKGCLGLDASLPAGAQHHGPGCPSSIQRLVGRRWYPTASLVSV